MLDVPLLAPVAPTAKAQFFCSTNSQDRLAWTARGAAGSRGRQLIYYFVRGGYITRILPVYYHILLAYYHNFAPIIPLYYYLLLCITLYYTYITYITGNIRILPRTRPSGVADPTVKICCHFMTKSWMILSSLENDDMIVTN